MNRGILYGLTAYAIWGLLPLYWKALSSVPPLEILSHRMVWSLVVIVGLLAYRRRWSWLPELRDLRLIGLLAASALMLTINWFAYIWGVNNGHVIETSLGYFINPLVNVLLGVLLFREVLRPAQWSSVGLALIGVLYLTMNFGSLPWIALALAFSFAFYGVLKKKSRLGTLEGLSVETALLAPPALLYLIWLGSQGTGALGEAGVSTTLLLVGAGVATAVPLLCFSAAARRVPLSTIGFMQYLAPTIQFMLGIVVFREPFSTTRLIGFLFIWAALVLYSIDGIMARRQRLAARVSA